MNRTFWARALRLPLVAALAVNLVVVAATPFYRARTARLIPQPPRTAGEFDSLPVSAEASGRDGDGRASEPANPEPPADSAVPADASSAKSAVPAATATTDQDDLAPSAKLPLSISGETLSAVGRSWGNVHGPSHALGRPLARAASRATRWLTSAADPRESASPVFDREPDGNGSTAPPIADTAPQPSDMELIVVWNTADGNLPVAFLVGEQVQSLAPGKQFAVRAAQATVRFDRGQSFGESTRTLAPGVYRFVVTERGWDLQGPDESNVPAHSPAPR